MSLSRARDELRSMFWVIPTACVAASIGLALGLVDLDHALGASNAFYLYPGPPSGARSFLSSITTAMISFTGLVFSITIVALQLTSGQFSSRVIRVFLRDRVIRFSLGVFVATFVYAMMVQRAVVGTNLNEAFVPQVAVTMAFVLVLASVGMFILYIDHVANMMRVATLVSTIGEESGHLMADRYPPDQPPGESDLRLPPAARTVAAPRGAVVVSVNEAGLVDLARRAGVTVGLVPRIGDYVVTGAPLLSVHPDDGSAGRRAPLSDADLVSEVAFDSERTMEQDLAFGFRQLVDIAQRALSPGINDPTTATQVLDVLHDLLHQLATRHLPNGRIRDAEDRVRLIVPQYEFADFMDLAVGEIWRYGSDAARVPQRMARLVADVAEVALPEHRATVLPWAACIDGTGPVPNGRELAWPPASSLSRLGRVGASGQPPQGGSVE